MTRNQVIEELFTGKNFNDCLQKMEPDYLREDLKQEVAVIVCEWPEEKVIGLYQRKELDFYVVRVILNLVKSKTSPFAKRYRTLHIELPIAEIVDTTDRDREDQEQLREYAARVYSRYEEWGIEKDNNLYYQYHLIKLYLDTGNFRAIEQLTRIPFTSCYKTIKKSLKELRVAGHPAARPVQQISLR